MIKIQTLDTMTSNPYGGAAQDHLSGPRGSGARGHNAGAIETSVPHTRYAAGAKPVAWFCDWGFFSLTPQLQMDKAMDAKEILYRVIAITCDDLSDRELAELNEVAQAGKNPHGRSFDYGLVQELFTEDDGNRMHDAGKEILALYTLERLR